LLLLPLTITAKELWGDAAKEYGIDPNLLHAIAKVESNVNANLISINFRKLTPQKRQKLYRFLDQQAIKYHTFRTVIAMKTKDIKESITTIDFLYDNGYKSFDIGMMQINTIHKPTLDQAGITLYDLMNPTLNVRVGAFILSRCFHKHPKTKDAINAYNGKIEGNPYFSRVEKVLKELEASREFSKDSLKWQPTIDI
jgi:hypothetical protein